MSDEYPIKNLVQQENGTWILTYLNEELIPYRDAIQASDAEGLSEKEVWKIADERYASYLDLIANPPEQVEKTPEEVAVQAADDIRALKDQIVEIAGIKAEAEARAELDAEFG